MHYLQKEKKPMDKFINLYHSVMVREFQAHDDAITHISKINEPSCFVTCSKDKKFKIWNYNCEILGEVHTQPPLNYYNPNPVEWKFKIDWEKLKEEEIIKVIEIYESLGGEASKYDAKIHGPDILYENKEEVHEETKRVNRIENTNKKKRYKPLEIQTAKKVDDADEEAENKYEVIICIIHRINICKISKEK
jgi:hypothetical protein